MKYGAIKIVKGTESPYQIGSLKDLVGYNAIGFGSKNGGDDPQSCILFESNNNHHEELKVNLKTYAKLKGNYRRSRQKDSEVEGIINGVKVILRR